VRRGVVLRGASLHRLAGVQADRARALSLRTAVDLRTDGELSRSGGFPGEDLAVEVLHLPLLPSVWSREVVAQAGTTEPDRFLADRYREMLEVGGPAISGTLALLADPAALPLVFFCAAGKDRTGVTAAILLGLLGVSEDDIAADFHASHAPVERMIRWLIEQDPTIVERMVDQDPRFLAAPQGAIRLFLAELADRHGSIADYASSIGVTDEQIAQLRAGLLEPA
jgi:protein-tyrosine phosphatase